MQQFPRRTTLLQFRPFFKALKITGAAAFKSLPTSKDEAGERTELLCGSEKSAFAKYFSLG